MKKTSKLCLTALIVALAFIPLTPAMALDQWPTKQLNIVVPFSPGGTTDRIARALGPFLEKELGVPVVLINRKGGGGIIGTNIHLKNDPVDGSFIVYTLEPYLSGAIFKGVFELEDFHYLGLNYYSPQGLWVHATSEYTSAKDLLLAMKKNPGKITMSVIPNSWSRVGNALFWEHINAYAKEIPYQSGGKQRMGVVKKEVVSTIVEVYGTLASTSEDMRCLAVFDDKSLPELPDVPTINEVLAEMKGRPMPSLTNFRFFMVKKEFMQKYPQRSEMLEKAIARASLNPEYQKIMSNQKLHIQWKGSAATTEIIEKAHKTLEPFAGFWRGKKK